MSQSDPWTPPPNPENPTGQYGTSPQYGTQPQYGTPAQYGSSPGYGTQPGYADKQAGWGQPGGFGPPAPQATNTLAILSLIFVFVFFPAAIVLGVIAKRQIRERNEGGSGLATAGIVLGSICAAILVLSIVLALIGLALAGGSSTGV